MAPSIAKYVPKVGSSSRRCADHSPVLPGVTVQGERVSVATGNSALSAIDTGTTLIGGPSDDVAAIWAAVPGSRQSATNQGFYTFRKFVSCAPFDLQITDPIHSSLPN